MDQSSQIYLTFRSSILKTLKEKELKLLFLTVEWRKVFQIVKIIQTIPYLK